MLALQRQWALWQRLVPQYWMLQTSQASRPSLRRHSWEMMSRMSGCCHCSVKLDNAEGADAAEFLMFHRWV
jgi:hypothetical protein